MRKVARQNGFRSKNDQVNLNQLSTVINHVRVAISVPDKYKHLLNPSFAQVLKKYFSDEKDVFYSSKVKGFEEQLELSLITIESAKNLPSFFSVHPTVSHFFNIKGNEISLLKRLISLGKQLQDEPAAVSEMEFFWLETQLRNITSSREDLSIGSSFESNNFLILALRKLRKIRLSVIKTISRELIRDIRNNFRNIIRFLFKNMNDESGFDNALFTLNFKQSFYQILQRHNNGQGRNYRKIKIYSC